MSSGEFDAGESPLASDLERCLAALQVDRIAERVRARNHTVWREDPTEITNRLGWLDVTCEMRGRIDEIQEWRVGLLADGVRDVVLLGMGGSSLAPEVFRNVFGSAEGSPRLHVLDSTSPAWIRRVTETVDPGRTHVLVASKSGSTIEVRMLRAHFGLVLERAGVGGDGFTAITDPATSLEELAREKGWRHAFLNPPDIGGRFSALSLFGLVPAAVLGIDLGKLLDRAREMEDACGDDPRTSPGAHLGALLGASVRAGRDKLVLVASPALESFGLWVEQLLAESTGKDGTGIVPVVGEPVTASDDSLVVAVGLRGEPVPGLDALRGLPVLEIEVADRLSLGAEMVRFEVATAVAGHLLGVHPFDQPDVQSTKTRTDALLAGRDASGIPPVPPEDPRRVLETLRPGDWVGLMVYGDPMMPDLADAIAALRGRIHDRWSVPVTVGYGPRFLHSTGQLHKGGPDTGVFLQWLPDEGPLPIPGEDFGFGELIAAQAGGDLEALRAAGRRVARVDAREGAVASIRALGDSL